MINHLQKPWYSRTGYIVSYILPTPSYNLVLSGRAPISCSTNSECLMLLFSCSIWASDTLICCVLVTIFNCSSWKACE